MTCIAQATSTTTIRDNGLTELVGDVLISCTGGAPRQVNEVLPQVNIQVFTSPAVNITSKIIGSGAANWSEALLLVDEPAPAVQLACGSANAPNQPSPGSGQPVAAGVCGAHVGAVGDSAATYAGGAGPTIQVNTFPGGNGQAFNGCAATPQGNAGAAGFCAQTYRPNVFVARYAGNNSLIWQGIPIDPPGTNKTRIFRLTNIRVNASQLNNPSGLQSPVSLVVSTSASGIANPISLPMSNPTVTVAIAQTPLSTEVSAGACYAWWKPMTVTFSERYPTAFRQRSGAPATHWNQSPAPQPSVLGLEARGETGFYNPFFPLLEGIGGDLKKAGLADHGARLFVRIHNVNRRHLLQVPTILPLKQIGAGFTGFARLVTTDENGAGPFRPDFGWFGTAQMSRAGNDLIAVYEIMRGDGSVFEEFTIPIQPGWGTTLKQALRGASISYGLAPTSDVATASAIASIPRFLPAGTPSPVPDCN